MHAATTRRDAYRRTRRVAAGVTVAGILTFVAASPGSAAPGAPAEEQSFNSGTGTAIATGYKVNPIVGSLSFGITAGQSLAGHQNTGAQGQSSAIDLGVIGVTLAREGCEGAAPTLAEEDQPQPVIVFSDDEGAEAGVEEDEAGLITKFARATPAPFGEAVTTIAPLGDPAIALIEGGRTIATSGVIDGNVREARAYTQIASIKLGGGQIELRGLEWEAIHRSGAVEETIGRFDMGALVIGGEEQPLPEETQDLIVALDDALRNVGLTITPPTVRESEGFVFVDPLKIGLVPNETREAALGGLLEAAQPVREALLDVLSDLDCGDLAKSSGRNIPFNTFISVLDIVLSSVSGGGSLLLEVGGVQATTAEIVGFEFPSFGELPDLPSLPPELPDAPAAPTAGGSTGGSSGGTGGAASSPAGAAAGAAPADTAAPAEGSTGGGSQDVASEPMETIADLAGSRGGPLALVGAAGLILLLATAEGDRRKMHRAMREIPVEA